MSERMTDERKAKLRKVAHDAYNFSGYPEFRPDTYSELDEALDEVDALAAENAEWREKYDALLRNANQTLARRDEQDRVMVAENAELRRVLGLAVKLLPKLEVRSYPPGFSERKAVLTAAREALDAKR